MIPVQWLKNLSITTGRKMQITRKLCRDLSSDHKSKTFGNIYLATMRVTNDIHPIPDRMKHILLATKIGLVEGETRMHVRKRLSSLNTGNPFDLVLRGWFRCEDPRVYEKYWHEKFAPFRVRGEWFSLSPDQRLEIKNVMEEYHRTGEFRGNQELLDRVKNKSRQQCRVDAETIRTKAPRSNESFRIEVQAILNKHRRIARHGNGRSYLNETEQVMVEDALAMHPEAEEKIGCGVQKLFVQQSPEFRSFCFYVERVDGSEEQFSYRFRFGISS